MRRYGKWMGNPAGTPEDPERCVVECVPSGSWGSFQCSRKRRHGPDKLYCAQHAKMLEAGRLSGFDVPDDEPGAADAPD